MSFDAGPGSNVFEKYHRAFSRYGQGLKDFSQLFERLASRFWLWMAAQFKSQGASGATGKWAPLSARYLAWKRGKVGSMPILQLYGDLIRSFQRGGAGNVELITDRQMVLGSNLPKARHHQTGTSRMPRRPIIALTRANKREWDHEIAAWLRATEESAFKGLIKGHIINERMFRTLA